jgi:hypothetical protein
MTDSSTLCGFSDAPISMSGFHTPDHGPGLEFLSLPGGQRLAFRFRRGTWPALLFLPGYASDMDGAKALGLDAFAARRGASMLRFDYSGTGSSAANSKMARLEDGLPKPARWSTS